jgi:LPS sulfotransferase NodH
MKSPPHAERIEMMVSAEPGATHCRRRYVICSTPRTGSGLLSGGLTTTGVAGMPTEYLNGWLLKAYLRRSGAGSFSSSEYWRFMEARYTTPNGVFGTKLHYDQLVAVYRTTPRQVAFLRHFNDIIHISRRNKVAQAVSWAKALQTDSYTSEISPLRSAHYDAPLIARRLAAALTGEQSWERLFRLARRAPHRVFYEDLAGDFDGTVRRILQVMGLSAPEVELHPRLDRQGDGLNEEWIARFARDIFSLAEETSSVAKARVP